MNHSRRWDNVHCVLQKTAVQNPWLYSQDYTGCIQFHFRRNAEALSDGHASTYARKTIVCMIAAILAENNDCSPCSPCKLIRSKSFPTTYAHYSRVCLCRLF